MGAMTSAHGYQITEDGYQITPDGYQITEICYQITTQENYVVTVTEITRYRYATNRGIFVALLNCHELWQKEHVANMSNAADHSSRQKDHSCRKATNRCKNAARNKITNSGVPGQFCEAGCRKTRAAWPLATFYIFKNNSLLE